MFRVWKVTRIDDYEYEEFDAFAVVADGRCAALKIVTDGLDYGTWVVTEVDLTKPAVIVSSFNAG